MDTSTVTPQQIEDAARKANAYNFVTAFPQGFDTLVGERGLMLSGKKPCLHVGVKKPHLQVRVKKPRLWVGVKKPCFQVGVRKPQFQAGVKNPCLQVGNLTFSLRNLTFS